MPHTHRRALLRRLAGGAPLLLGAAAAPPALAQPGGAWRPTRPVAMLVPFAAGGPTDVMARLLAARLADRLGQPVAVENVGGAGGVLGTGRLARAAPDGHTVGLGHLGTHGANPAFYRRLPYDPATDFEPIGQYGTGPMVVALRPGLARDAEGLRAWVAANPRRLTLANAGVGSTTYLAALLLDRALGAGATLVPYRGAGPAMADTVAGVTDAIVDQASTVIPQAVAGGLVPVAVAAARRLPQLPWVPTAAEAGMPDLSVSVWNAAFAPRGTPAPALEAHARALSDALDEAAIRERFAALAVEIPAPEERGPDPLRRLVAAEVERWRRVVAEAGITPEG